MYIRPKTMHGDGEETEKLKRKSYFVEKEREEASKANKIYEKIFHTVYWLAKAEIAAVKFTLILILLESVGVKDIELFDMHSSHIFWEMVIMLSGLLKEKLISNEKKTGMYVLLSDEATDISSMQQLLTLVKYHNIQCKEPETKFLHTADILSGLEETSANGK